MNKKSFFGGLAIGLAGILAVGAMGWFNINHPNDFMARIYAQVILKTLLG